MTRLLLYSILVAVNLACASAAPEGPFLEKPYLQLGKDPNGLELMWQTAGGAPGQWAVEAAAKPGAKFRRMAPPAANEIRLQGTAPHVVYTAKLTGIGETFEYRVLLDGKVIFQARASGRPAVKSPYQVVVFGDSGADTAEQKEIAALTHKLAPSLVFHTGDIVYSRGLVSEYRTRHFPIYNSDAQAPLIRSVVMAASAGNHDLATRDLGKYPDALPYFYYWSMPLNGPELPMFAKLDGDPARVADFRKAAGASFSRMVNYSFDWGNSHWLVLDSNNYADWSNAEFQKWVADDLAAASKATWKFVGLHHPGFNSSKAHFKDQQARLLAPIFEKYGVDVVFSGHVHNYQRSYPLRFKPEKFDYSKSREVEGRWELDRSGATKANGVVYLVTGAGGNTLYNPEQEDDVKSWQEFTVKFVAKIHSLTQVKVDGKRADFVQLDRTGKEIDRFSLTK